MAMLIKADGKMQKVKPENRRNFNVKEVERLIDGKAEMYPLGDGQKMFLNIRQGCNALEFNWDASDILNRPVVGDVLICSDDEFSLS